MHPHMVIGRDKDGVKGKSLDRSTVRRVLAYADRYRAMLLGFVATLLVSSLLSIVPALLVRRIIDDAIPASDRGQVNSLALIMVGLALASGVISLIERFFSARIGENLIFDLRVQLFDHVQRMPIGFFTRTSSCSRPRWSPCSFSNGGFHCWHSPYCHSSCCPPNELGGSSKG